MASVANRPVLVEIRPARAKAANKGHLLVTFIVSGLLFMLVPGTLLGFSNLLSISTQHGAGALSAGWIQAHGHAQVFGWIGSFLLGIGFYSLPDARLRPRWLTWFSAAMWIAGVALRWIASVYSWHWRIAMPLSAVLELAAYIIFLRASSGHRTQSQLHVANTKSKMEAWMRAVLIGTLMLTFALVWNFVVCVRLALAGHGNAFGNPMNQHYLVLLGWGVIVPFVIGFSARWVPSLLALPHPKARSVDTAVSFTVIAVLSAAIGQVRVATFACAACALIAPWALELFRHASKPAPLSTTHRCLPKFIRVAYIWLIIASSLGVLAAFADHAGGLWGASRHALTVGFAATMVVVIGSRMLPFFVLRNLYSARISMIAVAVLNLGCALRVSSEPLAYELNIAAAWRVLPLSGILELTALSLFSLNLFLTFFHSSRINAAASAA